MPVKPGYQTTEFWLVVITTISGLVAKAGLPLDANLLSLITVQLTSIIPLVAYIIQRGAVKAAAVPAA